MSDEGSEGCRQAAADLTQYTTIQNTVAEAGKVVSLARAVLQRHPHTQAAFKHPLPRLHVNFCSAI